MLLVFGQHVHIEDTHNVFIYLVTYRPIGPGAFCVFVYVIVYNYVNVCTSHNNKPQLVCYAVKDSTGENII